MHESVLGHRLTSLPDLRREPGLRLAGAAGRFDETTASRIPALWPRLVARLPLEGQLGAETFGVNWTDADAAGGFHYMAAVRLAPEAPVPEGLEVMTIPPQTCLVFRLALDGGDLHPQMVAAMKEIWSRRLPDSGRRPAQGPVLEVYPPDFEPDRAGAFVDWWMPVEA